MVESVAGPVYVSVRRSQLNEPSLAGLLAAFTHEPGCAWLAVAVDLPWISAGTLERLLKARDPSRYARSMSLPCCPCSSAPETISATANEPGELEGS
jgi:molybdopterin-guanine dinucleotide biosynthesis protein A